MLRRLAFVPLAALGVATAFLVSGAGGAVTSVVLVSVDSAEVEADGASRAPSLSGDGRYVAFESDATNLAGIDPSTPARTDIFVRDLAAGVTERITAGNGSSFAPTISNDGRWVAFESGATNLPESVPFVDTNGRGDIFVYDRDTDTTLRVTHGNDSSSSAAISGDGNFVAFGSFASDLVPLDTATGDVFRWERTTGTMVKASISSGGAGGDDLSSIPDISDDGSVIVFNSRATNLIAGDTNATWDVFVRDLAAGTTEAASVSTAGVLAESTFFGSSATRISGNGRYVTFGSSAANLVAGFGSGVYLRDRVTDTTSYVSVGNGNSGGSGPAPVTNDGHVVFSSFAALVADDTNFRTDVYLASTPERISLTDTGTQATSANSSDGASSPTISGDGSLIVVQNRFASVIAGSTTFPNLVAYSLGPGGGSATTATTTTTTTTTPTTTTTTTTTPVDVTPPTVELPGRADLVVTKTAADPASGESFAPGEPIVYTLEVVNAGTRAAVNVQVDDHVNALQLGSSAPDVQMSVSAPECSVTPGNGGGPVVASATVSCELGTIPPLGGRKTVTYTVTLSGDRIPMTVTNRAEASFATNDADDKDNVAETSVDVDEGERDCEAGESCESGPGTTTTTCAGAETVCMYGGEGVMNTTCSGESICGGGPLRELKVCTDGATCKDKFGEPNVFRCSGEGTYCAGIGEFTCRDGAFCRVWGTDSTATCTSGSRLDLRGKDNTARVNGCRATIGDGNDAVGRGNGVSRVHFSGSGDFVRTGRGSVFIDAINGEKNVIDCNGGKSTVYVDDEDDPRDCETVIGADVAPSVFGGKTSWGWHIHNRGPADATQVRVNGRFSIERASILSSRVRSSKAKCRIEEVDTTAGAIVLVECLIPIIEAHRLVSISVDIDPTSDWKQIVQEVVARAGAPVDHKPENNDWHRVDESDQRRPGAR